LVEADAIKKQADQTARAVRDAFLAVPDRLASLLVGRTEKQIAAELRKEIRATLMGLSIELSRKR
jgi:Xaa-Pro aminopeptidase